MATNHCLTSAEEPTTAAFLWHLSQEALTGHPISALEAVATPHSTVPTKFKAFSISN